MNSPLLQGGARRRRRPRWAQGSLRHRSTGARRRRVWPAAAVLLMVAAGAAAWFAGLRPAHHRPIEAAAIPHGTLLRESPAPVAKPARAPGPPSIALSGAPQLKVRLKQPPRAGLLFDLHNGRALWSLHPLDPIPIASLTKILSAIIVVERTRPRELARVTGEALNYRGQALGLLPPHQRVPVEGLLAGMLLTSANDAAITLADHVGHTDAGFARLMNATARRLHLSCSSFVSAYGLQDNNRSCAADLGALSRIAMGKPRIARLAREEQARVPFPIKGGYLYVTSTNPLLHLHYPGTIGLKTGFTDRAGRCLVAVVRHGRRTLAVVLLHSPDPATQAVQLFDAAFHRRR